MNRFGKISFVSGIVACSANMLLIFLPVGFLAGVMAIVFGSADKARQWGARAGVILGLYSFLLGFIWIGSIGVLFLLDPALRFPG